LAEEYVAETTGCLPRAVQAAGIPCSAIPLTDIELRFQQDPKVRELRFQSTLSAKIRVTEAQVFNRSKGNYVERRLQHYSKVLKSSCCHRVPI
jgi:hypothetical protein